jgi:RNA polymerase subunit RPABC4/transcription elongation factor Spt4
MVGISIFRFRAELACPRCSSSNLDKKYMHMGELACRHCQYFWRVE